MAALFNKQYLMLWTLVLSGMLFFPVRQLIWTLYIRRAERGGSADDEKRATLKKRATVTAGLLTFVFSFVYTSYLFSSR